MDIATRVYKILRAVRAIETLGRTAKIETVGKAITDDEQYRKLVKQAGRAEKYDFKSK